MAEDTVKVELEETEEIVVEKKPSIIDRGVGMVKKHWKKFAAFGGTLAGVLVVKHFLTNGFDEYGDYESDEEIIDADYSVVDDESSYEATEESDDK